MSQSMRLAALVTSLLIGGAMAMTSPAGAAERGRYIVVLKDSVEHPASLARAQTEQRNGELGFVYRHALKGYSAVLSEGAVEGLRRNPKVASVTLDRKVGIVEEEELGLETEDNGEVEVSEASIPTGIERAMALQNEALYINGEDDVRPDVDVAVIDTGIDYNHPDLYVAGRTNCVPPGEGTKVEKCIDNGGTDGHSHGTHVAGTVGAIDNGLGVVGVAPGARLWAVRALNNAGEGYVSWIIAGVDWVTAHAGEIEVANMSLGCVCSPTPLKNAIKSSTEAGVVYAVAAGNNAIDAASVSPASVPNVITVSALADYDGEPGGKTSGSCKLVGSDDTLANFSNYGATIEVAAPGVCILSTRPGGAYGTMSGTSMASPHVAGAAAILAALDNPDDLGDVNAIRETIAEEGNYEWTDTSEDGVQEPLLDVSDESTFRIVSPAWEIQATPNPGSAKGSRLEAASCSSPTACTAVGYYEDSSGVEKALIERWNGTEWKIVSAPNPSGASSTYLTEVDCTSSTHCVAVGHYLDGSGSWHTLAERWSGGEWKIQSTPDPEGEGTIYPSVTGVSCTSSTACTAVGRYVDQLSPGNESQYTLAMRWDGTKWTIQSTPSPGAKLNWLEGVSCPTAEFCAAVGFYHDGSSYRPMALHWDGKEWKSQSVPDPAKSKLTYLYAVSCTSASACTATGAYGEEANSLQTLAERWNGTSWLKQSTPYPEGAKSSYLNGVSCSTATDCVASGYYVNGSGVARTLAEHWAGISWRTEATPNPEGAKAGYLPLLGVSCTYPTACTAVGYYQNSSGVFVTLAERLAGGPPSVTAQPATGVVPSGATLNGTIDPNSAHTVYQFEWGTDTSYGNSVPVTPKDMDAGDEPNAVEAEIEGLVAKQTYHFRLVAENDEGTAVSEDRQFTTPYWGPTAVTTAASSVGNEGAVLNGTVNPEGLSTTYQFEYGTTTEYGSKAPAEPQSIGSGEEDVLVSEPIETLLPHTTYHFRVVGKSSGGTSYGEDQTFTTEPLYLTRFQAEAYPATIAGGQDPEQKHTLTLYKRTIECEEAHFDAETEQPTAELPVEAEYVGCSNEFLGNTSPASVDMNSCHYVLRLANTGAPYNGSMDLACEEEGDAIELSVYADEAEEELKCRYAIGPQEGLGDVGYANLGEGSEGAVEVGLDLKGVSYAREWGTFAACGSALAEASYKGASALNGSFEEESTRAYVARGLQGIALEGEESAEGELQPRLVAASYYLATIAGGQDPDGKHAVELFRTTECEGVYLDTQIGEATTELPVYAVEYVGCSDGLSGKPVSVDMNSCRYVLHVANAGPPYAGSMDVACEKEGDAVGLSFYSDEAGKNVLCRYAIAPQAGLEGISYANLGAGGEAAVEVGLELTEVAYTRAAGTFVDCGASEAKAAYNGASVLYGF